MTSSWLIVYRPEQAGHSFRTEGNMTGPSFPEPDTTCPVGDRDLLTREVAGVPEAVLTLPDAAWVAAGQEAWTLAAALVVGLQLARVYHQSFERDGLLSACDLDYVRVNATRSPRLLLSNAVLSGVRKLGPGGTASGPCAAEFLPRFAEVSGELLHLAQESTRGLGRHGIRHDLALHDSSDARVTGRSVGAYGVPPAQLQLLSAFTPILFEPLELEYFRLTPSPRFGQDWEATYGRYLDLIHELQTTPSAVLQL
jgi:hypothetical protein